MYVSLRSTNSSSYVFSIDTLNAYFKAAYDLSGSTFVVILINRWIAVDAFYIVLRLKASKCVMSRLQTEFSRAIKSERRLCVFPRYSPTFFNYNYCPREINRLHLPVSLRSITMSRARDDKARGVPLLNYSLQRDAIIHTLENVTYELICIVTEIYTRAVVVTRWIFTASHVHRACTIAPVVCRRERVFPNARNLHFSAPGFGPGTFSARHSTVIST